MARKRVAVLISGRGSNMQALLEAAKDEEYPAEIWLVVSNRPDAAGLDHAREARRARGRPHRHRLPRRLHAAVDALVREAMGGAAPQHPPRAPPGAERP